jgi:hypothetical protein
MNPMKELKSEFDTLKSLIGNEFHETNLNKAEPKTTYIQKYPDYQMTSADSDYNLYEKKGVQSDFIKILKIKLNKKNHYSLGFVFNYLDIKEPSMHYSLKVNNGAGEDVFFTSEDMNLKEMKEKMKKINKSLVHLDDKKIEDILNIINQEFINKNINELDAPKIKKIKP